MSELKFDALSLEYNSLRQEISGRMNSRYQTLTLLAATAGVIIGFAPEKSGFPKEWVYGLGLGLFLVGLFAWLHAGWSIGSLSKQVAQLEADINLVASETSQTVLDLLTWEKSRQNRKWRAILFGPGQPPNPDRLK